MRHAALLLLLCSCSSLSSDEQEQLALFQRNAKLYLEAGNISQAYGQVEKGLDLDPDDYQLNTIYGALLLRTSPTSLGTDQRNVDRAIEVLARQYETRAADRHLPALLLHYAVALQKKGRHHLAAANRLLARGAVTGESESAAQLAEERRQSDAAFDQAEELFAVLIERGEQLRLSHKHLMAAARDRGDAAGVAAHKEQYLLRVSKEQAFHSSEITRTNEPGYENEQKVLLAQLRQEELDVRSLLAGYHYRREEYEAALSMLSRVLDLDPRRSSDYYNRGRVLLHLDRDQDAKADFRKFLATTDLPSTSEKAIFAATILTR